MATVSDDLVVKLKEIAIARAKEGLTPDYFNQITEPQRFEEGLGLLIARATRWDGIQIMRIFTHALEDANFHEQAAKVDEMIEKLA